MDKVKVLYLYDKKNPAEADFIFENGGYGYTWLDENGCVRILSFSDRIDNKTNISEIVEELGQGKAQEYNFDGDYDSRKTKIDNVVLQNILNWHYSDFYKLSDFDIIKMEKGEHDANNIKAFLMIYGGFKFDKIQSKSDLKKEQLLVTKSKGILYI